MHLADPYSFTGTKPRINHEWLSESLMYVTYAAAGDSGPITLKLTLLVAMLTAIVTALRAVVADRPLRSWGP